MIFVRFSKRNGDASKDGNKCKSYRRAVRIGDSCLVQDGDKIVAYAFLNLNKEYELKILDCDKKLDYERYTKRLIGNSAKWMNLNEKRRKYRVFFIKDFSQYNFGIGNTNCPAV